MKIEITTLETCGDETGAVVVIDVLRAFTSSAYAFSAGVREIILVSTVTEAFTLKRQYPEAILMGEVGGLPVEGFDYGNSPTPFIGQKLDGRRMILRTSAGTQSVVRCKNAKVLLACSLICATATVRYIRSLAPEKITFVITGSGSEDGGEEDIACADFIEAQLKGQKPENSLYIQRVRRSAASRKFLDPAEVAFPMSDLEYALVIDRFTFPIVVERQNCMMVLKPGEILM
jgi:2-phosphosulfolactate phosphatase